jgi:hypothetical protein
MRRSSSEKQQKVISLIDGKPCVVARTVLTAIRAAGSAGYP